MAGSGTRGHADAPDLATDLGVAPELVAKLPKEGHLFIPGERDGPPQGP